MMFEMVTHRFSEPSDLGTLALSRFESSRTSSASSIVSARDAATEAVSFSERSSNGNSRPNELLDSCVNVCLSIELGSSGRLNLAECGASQKQ